MAPDWKELKMKLWAERNKTISKEMEAMWVLFKIKNFLEKHIVTLSNAESLSALWQVI